MVLFGAFRHSTGVLPRIAATSSNSPTRSRCWGVWWEAIGVVALRPCGRGALHHVAGLARLFDAHPCRESGHHRQILPRDLVVLPHSVQGQLEVGELGEPFRECRHQRQQQPRVVALHAELREQRRARARLTGRGRGDVRCLGATNGGFLRVISAGGLFTLLPALRCTCLA